MLSDDMTFVGHMNAKVHIDGCPLVLEIFYNPFVVWVQYWTKAGIFNILEYLQGINKFQCGDMLR